MTPAEIFELISKYGPGVIFAVLYYLERDERKDAQKELKQLSRDTITALTEMKSLVGLLASLFKATGSQ